MNQRIEKLAEQAGIWKPTHDHKTWVKGEYISSPGEFEKFAELIVLEMCQVMKAEGEQFSLDQNFDAVKGVGRCMRKVKEHFGVDK